MEWFSRDSMHNQLLQEDMITTVLTTEEDDWRIIMKKVKRLFPKLFAGTMLLVLALMVSASGFIGALASEAVTSPDAPTFSLDGTRTQLRIQHALLANDNVKKLSEDYTEADAIKVFYTDDGSEPSDTNGTRVSIVAGSVRAYIFDPVQGTTYKAVVYNGDSHSAVATYVMPPSPPKWQFSDGTPMTTNGLYNTEDVAKGIELAATAGQKIYYKSAVAEYDVELGVVAPTEFDTITPSELAASGTLYSGPISTEGVDETHALVIKSVAVIDGREPFDGIPGVPAVEAKPAADGKPAIEAKPAIPAVPADPIASFYVRAGEPLRLTADKDGSLTVDLDAFVRQLSVDERIALTSGIGGDPTTLLNGINYPLELNNDGIPKRGGPAGGTLAIPRFNIPALVMADGPAGVRMWKNATVWMAPAGLGSTWNVEIPKLIGEATAKEATYFATDIVLGPGLNTQRYPLAGRNFEYYSEDPYIAGYAAKAYTAAIQAGGVGTSLKHYAANDYETGRGGGSSDVTERALREIYLRPFEIAAEVQPWTYMSGYNAINGVLDHVNKWLLTDVLRGEWGFQGYVMSDWGTNNDPAGTFEAQMDMGQSSRNQPTVRGWVTGTSEAYATKDRAELVRRTELINRSVKNILRVLVKTSAFRGEYGVLQPDGTYADGEKLDGTPVKGLTQQDIGQRSGDFGGSEVQQASAIVNKQAADEAIVLLKNNDDLLPLGSGTKVALVTSRLAWAEQFDPRWYGDSASIGDVVIQGTGSAQVRFNNNTTPYSISLRDALADRGLEISDWKIDAGAYGGNDEVFKSAYKLDVKANPKESKYRYSAEQYRDKTAEAAAWAAASAVSPETGAANAKAAAEAAAASADVGVFVLTRVSGEGKDLTQELFDLSELERAVFSAYAEAFHNAGKKIVVLINVGGTVNTAEFRSEADAVLDIWNPGTEGTRAIADILVGNVNPSGRLAQSFPQEYNDSPSVALAKAGHENTYNGPEAYYDEGVLVGYRYFETNPDKYADMVAFPFGYGLGYTTFSYTDLKLDKTVFSAANQDDAVTATVRVTNTGSAAGKEVVQLYLSADTWESEGRPKNELKAYAKTRLLKPGEYEDVALTLKLRDLQYYDDGNPEQYVPTAPEHISEYGLGNGWTVADGTKFTVMIRTNASDRATPNAAFDGLTETFVYGK